MDGSSIEFTAKKTVDSGVILKRCGILAAFYLPFALLAIIFLKFFFAAIPVLFVLISYGVWYFWRYTKIEYEYSITGGEFSVCAIYDNKSRSKPLVCTMIKNMRKIAPYSPENNTQNNGIILRYCSDLNYEDLYFCEFEDPKKGDVCVIFNASEKLAKTLKYYNPQQTILKSSFRI